jgi:hypothetical protein
MLMHDYQGALDRAVPVNETDVVREGLDAISHAQCMFQMRDSPLNL